MKVKREKISNEKYFSHKKSGAKYETRYAALLSKKRLLVVLSFQYFTTTVKAVWADVVTHMCFTSCWLDT